MILLFHLFFISPKQVNLENSSTTNLICLFFVATSGLGLVAIGLSTKLLINQVELLVAPKFVADFLVGEFSYDYLKSLTS